MVSEHESDYVDINRPWPYTITKVIVEDGITGIGYRTFADTAIQSAQIADSVESIGDKAFYDCDSLTSVNISDSVTSIGSDMFYNCRSLENIEIPDGVTNISSNALYNCSSLTDIKIPESVTKIDSNAFYGCRSLTSVEYESTDKQWGRIDIAIDGNAPLLTAALKCGGTELEKPLITPDPEAAKSGTCGAADSDNVTWEVDSNNVLTISGTGGIKNFYRNIPTPTGGGITDSTGPWPKTVTKVIVEEGVTSIGANAFRDCTRIQSIQIADSVKDIGEKAFYNCDSLESVNIPDSVTAIGYNAFYDCDSLESVNIPDSVTSISFYAFCDCSNLTDIKIPESVTEIGSYTFSGCRSLTDITLSGALTNIGKGAFYGCYSLADVEFSGTVRQWRRMAILEDNDSLLKAALKCSDSEPEITPAPKPTDPTPTPDRPSEPSPTPVPPLEVEPVVPEVDRENNTVEFTVSVTDPSRAAELENIELFVAEYDEQGHIIGITIGTKSAIVDGAITVSAEIPSSDNYKFLLWDGSNAPLMNAVDDIDEISAQ